MFAAGQARLAARPVPDSVLKPGTMVAETGLLDPYGQPTTMYAALAGRPAVLVSYRGGWCPYCNIALAAYQAQLLPELQRRGVGMVAVSPQKPDESLSLQEKQDLRFKNSRQRAHTARAQRGLVTADDQIRRFRNPRRPREGRSALVTRGRRPALVPTWPPRGYGS